MVEGRHNEDEELREGLLELTGDLYRTLVEQLPAVAYIDSNEQRPDSLYSSPQARRRPVARVAGRTRRPHR